ncbi:ras-related protein Rab-4B-like, partial [Scleropages formosus]
FLFKFLVIGSAGTGKSCLLHQFIENKFKQDSNHTIGVEFGSRVVNVGGKTVKLQIWDTAGQERFRSVTRSYYRGAAGALLVYDITSRETYNSLTNWLTDARTLASPNIIIILCGNKKDLDADREVTFLEASRFAQENELMFLETSALTGENVEEAFLKCARTILNKIESGELDPERMGSGIQYGDTSLRQLRQPRSAAAQTRPQILAPALLELDLPLSPSFLCVPRLSTARGTCTICGGPLRIFDSCRPLILNLCQDWNFLLTEEAMSSAA